MGQVVILHAASVIDCFKIIACVVSALPLDDGIVQQEHVDTARAFCEKAKAIEGVLARDHMKVVFFGR